MRMAARSDRNSEKGRAETIGKAVTHRDRLHVTEGSIAAARQ
jgi:hypothetical protein